MDDVESPPAADHALSPPSSPTPHRARSNASSCKRDSSPLLLNNGTSPYLESSSSENHAEPVTLGPVPSLEPVTMVTDQPETLLQQEPITLDGLTLTERDDVVGGSVTEKGSVEDLFQEPGGVREQPRNNSRDLPVVAPEEEGLGGDVQDEVDGAGELETVDDEAEQVDEDYPEDWYTRRKHFFVLSEAGKPVYSRHGDDNIVGLFGVMQALVSCVLDMEGDQLNCIRTGDRLFVFRSYPPLIFVAVCDSEVEQEELVARQLKYVSNVAVFFFTQSHMERLFRNRHGFDLKRLLTGLPKFFNSIIRFVEEEPAFLLSSTQCLPMPSSLRSEITTILLSNRCPELVFAILLYRDKIISVVRPKQYAISPGDIHLLANYVQTGSSRGHGEKWAPCCLPDFNDTGFLYVHDSYISETMDLSLLLITNEREEHTTIIGCKERIVTQMKDQGIFEKIEAIPEFLVGELKIPHLRHFIYKSSSSQQMVAPALRAPYLEDRKGLYAKYCHAYDKLHHSAHKLSHYYEVDEADSVVGWVMGNAEIYCTFSPLVSRPVVFNNIDKLIKWIRKEESRFFILGTGQY